MKGTVPMETVSTASSRKSLSLTIPGRQSNKEHDKAMALERRGVQRKLGYQGSGEGSFLFCCFSSLIHLPL